MDVFGRNWMSADKHRAREQYGDTGIIHYHILTSGRALVLVRHSHAWHPPTDVVVEGERVVILVEVAGMQRGEFHISLHEQHLAISGTRPTRPTSNAAYNQMEVRYGDFRTDVMLPWSVDESAINATYDDGFLCVELPRAKPHRVHIVEVNTVEDDSVENKQE
jgi:HSP20 family molecular chaperone IbpA